MPVQKKKKETDFEALNSSLMKIPHFKVDVARFLLDIGIQEIYHLQGRCEDSLLGDIKRNTEEIPFDILPYLRLAIYYADNTEPEQKLLHPNAWS